jgi:hypothetical protein
MEPPLLLRGCVSPEGSHLGFVVHDRVKYLRTPREETLPDFHWYTEFSLPLVQVFNQSKKQRKKKNLTVCLQLPCHGDMQDYVFRNSEVRSKLYVTTLKCPPSRQIST